MLICMTKDIKRDLKSINKKVIDKKTRSKIIKRFKELIQFHYDAKQLSDYVKATNDILNVNVAQSLNKNLIPVLD